VAIRDAARFHERIRHVGKDRLEDELTVEDPKALTRPSTVKIPYLRVTSVDRMVHGDCSEDDRDPVINGEIKIVPRKP
jgi:hypothetical protein